MKSFVSARAEGSGDRGGVERADYLIDRFPVRYAYGGGWTCKCGEFIARGACKHTREAAGRRAAQAQIAEHLRRGVSDSFTLHKHAHGR